MSYSKNPNLPKVRAQAVKMVRAGHSTRTAARHFGFAQSTIVKWNKKVPPDVYDFRPGIPTESSRPRHHPQELGDEIVKQILEYRYKTRRGADSIHFLLQRDGVAVSLGSVKRTLKRHGLTKYGKWKKWHQQTPRPLPQLSGLLVEVDTIHDGVNDANRLYVYALLDVHSRWAYAEPAPRISAGGGAKFVIAAQKTAPLPLKRCRLTMGQSFPGSLPGN